MSPETHPNLLATGPETRLPEDPALTELTHGGLERFLDVVRAHPTSSLCWALLAEGSLLEQSPGGDVAAYAYARTGYHRGLDALRRSGWKGSGPVPWDHVPNQGFLRCLWALGAAAGRIGEVEEQERCAQFLRDSSEQAYQVLSATTSDGDEPAEDGSPKSGAAPDEPEADDVESDDANQGVTNTGDTTD